MTVPVEELIGGVRTRFMRVSAPLGRTRVSAGALEISSIVGLVSDVTLQREAVRCIRVRRKLTGTRLVAVMLDGTMAKIWFVTTHRSRAIEVLERFGWPVST